ncbi:MAG: hypothetical protein F4X66_03210 [Chloroflexi bacterium]|nr:hypothetical protein [Chloroflexota bacterium]MYE39294.1 hypothetical protein [Chloroflexota bacterium]
MLERIRGFVKQLELPQDEDETVVYRIIDGARNAVEVSAAQYATWRLRNDVAKLAVVGQDKVGDFLVRTTFSVMPENRSYKPFGTSAYKIPDFDPATAYSRRYDTWREAELGHYETVELLRQEQEVADSEAEKQNKAIEIVRRAFALGLPGLFQVEAAHEYGVLVRTPWVLLDGSPVDLIVVEADGSFSLSGTGPAVSGMEEHWQRQIGAVCETLGVTQIDGSLVIKAENAGQMLESITLLMQAVISVDAISR